MSFNTVPARGSALKSGTALKPDTALAKLHAVLDECFPLVVACSGGIDSLTLATVAHRYRPDQTVVAHTMSPAVPVADTARVNEHARKNGWDLQLVRSGEFDDERYLSNPEDRCYFCKSHLYDRLAEVAAAAGSGNESGLANTVISGANTDDLGEYRPGLIAAEEHHVRHPYVEVGISKANVRQLARSLDLVEADLPASPCLASRLYTGTRVTRARLHAVETGEAILRSFGFEIGRCRIRETEVRIEVPAEDQHRVTDGVLADIKMAIQAIEPTIQTVAVDDRPYRPGQAVLRIDP